MPFFSQPSSPSVAVRWSQQQQQQKSMCKNCAGFLNRLWCRYVQGNQISTLDGIEVLQQLQVLNIGSNQLTNLKGISALPKLETLICASNNLKGRDALQGLQQCTEVTTFDVQDNKLDHPEVRNLKSKKTLRVLHFFKSVSSYCTRICRNWSSVAVSLAAFATFSVMWMIPYHRKDLTDETQLLQRPLPRQNVVHMWSVSLVPLSIRQQRI